MIDELVPQGRVLPQPHRARGLSAGQRCRQSVPARLRAGTLLHRPGPAGGRRDGHPPGRDEIAFRCNLVTLDQHGRRPGHHGRFCRRPYQPRAEAPRTDRRPGSRTAPTTSSTSTPASATATCWSSRESIPNSPPSRPTTRSNRMSPPTGSAIWPMPAGKNCSIQVQATLAAHPVNRRRIEPGKTRPTPSGSGAKDKCRAPRPCRQRFGITRQHDQRRRSAQRSGGHRRAFGDQCPRGHRLYRHQLRRQGPGGDRRPAEPRILSSSMSRPRTRPAIRVSLADKIQAIEDFDGRIVRPIVAEPARPRPGFPGGGHHGPLHPAGPAHPYLRPGPHPALRFARDPAGIGPAVSPKRPACSTTSNPQNRLDRG